MRRQNLVWLVAAASLSVLPVGCDLEANKDEAMGLLDRYYAVAAGPDATAVLDFYSPRFFETTPRDAFAKVLTDLRARCGAPTSHTLKNWSASSNFRINPGSTATLLYEVLYPRCHVTETIVTFRPDGGERKIQGHDIRIRDMNLTPSEKTPTIV